jgi:nucleotide-binding universal stress UspA family protein
LIIAFADPKALMFLGVMILVLSIVYFISRYYQRKSQIQARLEEEIGGGRILVAAINPTTAIGLVELASRLAEHQEDTSISLLSVIKVPTNPSQKEIDEIIQKSKSDRDQLLTRTAPIAQSRNVAISTKLKVANNVESAIYKELKSPNPVRMIILGWPSLETKLKIPHNIIKEVLVNAQKDVLVLRNRGIEKLQKILIPIAGGPNSRLALRVARALAFQPGISVTVLHLTPEGLDDEKMEDTNLFILETIESVFGEIPEWMNVKVHPSSTVSRGIVEETERGQYDLMVIGAGEQVFLHRFLFGALNDSLIEELKCSMLIVRRYRPEAAIWLNERVRRLEV